MPRGHTKSVFYKINGEQHVIFCLNSFRKSPSNVPNIISQFMSNLTGISFFDNPMQFLTAQVAIRNAANNWHSRGCGAGAVNLLRLLSLEKGFLNKKRMQKVSRKYGKQKVCRKYENSYFWSDGTPAHLCTHAPEP